MADCPECAKKLLNASEAIAKAVDNKHGSFAMACRLRAEHYLDAVDIVCPDRAEARRKLAEQQGEL